MNQKWLVMIGVIIVITGLGSFLQKSPSNCKELTQAEKGEMAFTVCLGEANAGDAYAQNIVGVSYASGDNVKQDSEKSLKWFYKSAGQGFAKAQSNIGLAFLTSDGVDQSYTDAVQWWSLAAEQGEPHAQYNLAVSYECGCGIEQSSEVARKWYMQSAFSYLKLGKFHAAINSISQGYFL